MNRDPAARKQMLVVDDDATHCTVLARAFEARNFVVRCANDGASAVRSIECQAPEFAIVDLRLPDMSGLRVVQRLRNADLQTNIVVLTGYGSIATAVEAVKLGASYYVTKPSTADQIMQAFNHRAADADIDLDSQTPSVDRIEWEHIHNVLTRHLGNISATARALNMHRRTLQRKLYKHAPRA
jgi:two-component system, response regulator RegA